MGFYGKRDENGFTYLIELRNNMILKAIVWYDINIGLTVVASKGSRTKLDEDDDDRR